MRIKALPYDFSVCRVDNFSGVDIDREFCFASRTDEERSLVCRTEDVPENCARREDGWRGFRVEGPLDFSLVGILAGISRIMAENGIGIFAISTYDTDYVLVKDENIERALRALEHAGYEVLRT